CIWAAPFVADGRHGRVEVASRGKLTRVDVTVDALDQKPKIEPVEESSVVKTGTIFRLHWPQAARCLSDAKDAGSYNAHRLLRASATFNPHALFEMQASGQTLTVVPTDRQWQKWRPDWPTSPHWYTPEAFRTLIGAYIAEERRGGRVRTVREFVAEFDGLTGS